MGLSIYDQNRYYQTSTSGKIRRLSGIFEPLLLFFDGLNARWVTKIASLKSGQKVLDVGAGTGAFLSRLQTKGIAVEGTTLSETSQSAAQKRFGISLELAALPSKISAQDDVITYWHVFEHLEDPAAHLDRCRERLKENGTLILEVPNPEALGAKICERAWFGSDPQHHINMLSRASLRDLLKTYSFQVKSVSGFSPKFTVPYLVSSLIGFFLGRSVSCERLVAFLQAPFRNLKQAPLWTMAVIIAGTVAFPLAIVLFPLGILFKRGEVLRVTAQSQSVGVTA